MFKMKAIGVFISWLGAAMLISLIFVTIYATVQQSLRQSANDPQIEISEDISGALGGSQSAQDLVGPSVDMTTSLAPFAIIYGKDGQIAASGARLNGRAPTLPQGVLAEAKKRGQYRLTWQPQHGVRVAAVIQSSDNGYVLAGRSLREVERRENQAAEIAFAGWLGSMMILGAAVWLKWFLAGRA